MVRGARAHTAWSACAWHPGACLRAAAAWCFTPPPPPPIPPTHTHRDETTVLALTGLAKVLRAHLPAIAGLDGFDDKWDELAGIAGKVLAAGRKNVAVAAAQFLTGVLQARVCARACVCALL